MRAPHVRRVRGFSLIELLVALVVISVVIAGATQMLIGFQRTSATSNARREAGASGRTSLGFLQHKLGLLGFGIEPAFALDFTIYKENGTRCTNVGQVNGNDCPARRDRTDGPDELVFYARDPAYWAFDGSVAPEGRAWRVSSWDPSSSWIMLDVNLGTWPNARFPKGQILQLVCSGGASSTYVELSQSTTVSASGSYRFAIEARENNNPYRQSPTMLGGCTNVRAFLVHRYRFFVGERSVSTSATALVPFLLLDAGIDRNDDNIINDRDHFPVAPNVVDFQVAYARPETQTTTLEVAGTPGQALVICPVLSNPVVAGTCANGLRVVDLSIFNLGLTAAGNYESFSYFMHKTTFELQRSPDAPNVSNIHLMVVTRTAGSEGTRDTFPLRLNRNTMPATLPANSLYKTTELVVPMRNLQSTALSFL